MSSHAPHGDSRSLPCKADPHEPCRWLDCPRHGSANSRALMADLKVAGSGKTA